jgi:hypothetical protein
LRPHSVPDPNGCEAALKRMPRCPDYSAMRRGASILASGVVAVVVVGLTVAFTVGDSSGSNSTTNVGDLASAQRVADSIVVPGFTPSSACPGGTSHCFADSRSVISNANAVFDAMGQQTQTAPRLRCFPHRVGTLSPVSQQDTRTQVDSCVVDIPVDGHLAYAYIDPITSGSLAHLAAHGSTVKFDVS